MRSAIQDAIIDVDVIFGTMWPLERRDISLGNLRKCMNAFGIEGAVALSARGIFYSYTLGNEETKEVCSKDRRLIPELTIDPRSFIIGEGEEVKRRVAEGFKILRLFPEYQGFSIRGANVMRLMASAVEGGLPLMMPVQAGLEGILQALKELKGLRVILTGVGYSEVAEILAAMDECDDLYAETRILDSADGIDIIVERCGADRLIFGSGAPLGYVGSSLYLVKHAHIGEAERRAILGGNIRKLIGGN